MTTPTDTQENHHPLDLDVNSAQQEPSVTAEAAREFEGAALIGGEKLRTSGYFVNVVNRPSAPHAPVEHPLVLIVEDEPGTSMVIDAVLRKQGFGTRLAENLQAILRGMNAKPRPDVILLDILLPDANGFAVLERLRRHQTFATFRW